MNLKTLGLSCCMAFGATSLVAQTQENTSRSPEEILCEMSQHVTEPRLEKTEDGYNFYLGRGPLNTRGIPLDQLYNQSMNFVHRAENDPDFPQFNALGETLEEMVEIELIIANLGQELSQAVQNTTYFPDIILPICTLMLSSSGRPVGYFPTV